MVRPQKRMRLPLQVVRAQDLDDAIARRQLLHPGRHVREAGRRTAGLHPLRLGGRVSGGRAREAARRKADRASGEGDKGCGGG